MWIYFFDFFLPVRIFPFITFVIAAIVTTHIIICLLSASYSSLLPLLLSLLLLLCLIFFLFFITLSCFLNLLLSPLFGVCFFSLNFLLPQKQEVNFATSFGFFIINAKEKWSVFRVWSESVGETFI